MLSVKWTCLDGGHYYITYRYWRCFIIRLLSHISIIQFLKPLLWTCIFQPIPGRPWVIIITLKSGWKVDLHGPDEVDLGRIQTSLSLSLSSIMIILLRHHLLISIVIWSYIEIWSYMVPLLSRPLVMKQPVTLLSKVPLLS